MKSEERRLSSETPDILVATPGRLLDHLQNASLLPRLSALKVLIFDEADRLLDMGFRWGLHPLDCWYCSMSMRCFQPRSQSLPHS